jgi:transcriptional regulator with XRE-family HTH domain
MKKTNAEILQERLKRSRAPYNSVREFAEAVGVKESTMYKWLNSTPVWPDEPNLRVIANYYGISVDQLTKEVSNKLHPKAKETAGSYNVATYENVARLIDRLPADDKKKIAIYSVQAIAV